MINNEELFEEYLQQLCKKKSSKIDSSIASLDIFKVTKDLGYCLIERIRYSYGKELPVPYIGYIDENVINACAFIYKNKDFIGINAGTVLILFTVFSRILSHPELFLHIGDVSKETVPEQFFDSVTDFRYLDQNDTVVPSDPIRAKHAFQLALVALDFLVTHEYGHLIFGHIHLNSQYQGETNLFELESNETSCNKAIGGLTRQTLEMDADVFGANIGFRNVLADVNRFREQKIQVSPFYTSTEDALYNWMFSIYTMFRLFDSKHNINELELLNYPPSAVRAFYIASTIITNYQPSNYPKHYFADILVNARLDSESALDKVFYNELDKESLTYDYIQAALIHSSKLTHNWKNVAPLLLPFSRGVLAPIRGE